MSLTAGSARQAEQQERYGASGGRIVILVALSTLLGLVLRIAMARRGGLWCDEAQFLWIVRMPTLRSMIDFLWHHECHPPLFYMAMRAWLGLFGDSEMSADALPVLLGMAIIPIAYRVGNQVFSRQTGLIAMLLMVAIPSSTLYSGFVRPYSLLPLLCLISLYMLWQCLTTGGIRNWAAHAVASLAMLFTHNWAWMVFGGEVIVVGICYLRGRVSRATFRQWLLAEVAVLAGYTVWFPILLHQIRYAGYGPQPVRWQNVIAMLATVATSIPYPAALGLAGLFAVAAAQQLASRARKESSKRCDGPHGTAVALFLGIPAVAFGLAVLLSSRSDLLKGHCLTTLTPCIVLVVGFAISSWSSYPRLVAGVLASLYLFVSTVALGWQKSNAVELARAMTSCARPSDVVVISPFWFASSFQYYAGKRFYEQVYPYNVMNGAVLCDRMRDRLLDAGPMARFREELEGAFRDGRRVWLVTQRDRLDQFTIPPENDDIPSEWGGLGYMDIGYSRAKQIASIIEARYGKPGCEICPGGDRQGLEILRASLYSPGGAEDSPSGPHRQSAILTSQGGELTTRK